jgi:nitroimidazol reductase NimA-like FMN-containing flavoprotein (pyridoxamine 5'-phosphate oxidase superfamily)
MTEFDQTPRNRVRRLPERASYDRETIYPILEEALICHAGFEEDGQPFVIPTLFARDGDTLYLHGAKASRLLKHIQAGNPVCISVTLLDGLVLARSVFHHSVNYRSAVLFGRGRLLETDEEKLQALEAITEHIARGRWADARPPNRKELNATGVAAVAIESASAKVRGGPPKDDAEDYTLPVWAGILPLELRVLEPQDDPGALTPLPAPEYIQKYRR